jgi:hypothetical protein
VRSGKIVPAGFDQHHIKIGKAPTHGRDGCKIDRGILANGGVRTAAGLNAHDALHRQGVSYGQEPRVLLGIDVVGDGADIVAVAQRLAECFHKGGLAGANRAADADA